MAIAEREGVKRIINRVEALVTDIFSVVMRLEPAVTESMKLIFGSPLEMLASLRKIDASVVEDEELRRQLEAMQSIPSNLIDG